MRAFCEKLGKTRKTRNIFFFYTNCSKSRGKLNIINFSQLKKGAKRILKAKIFDKVKKMQTILIFNFYTFFQQKKCKEAQGGVFLRKCEIT